MVNRWGKSGNCDRFYFLGSKIITNSDCGQEIKRYFLLGRKAMSNLDSVLKSRDITLPTNVCIVKATFFPSSLYRPEGCTIKKAEDWKIDTFKLWWRRQPSGLQEKKSNQSILKEINLEYWLEGLMLKLKLQYFSQLMWRADSLEKSLMLGKTEGRRRRGRRSWDDWMPSLTQWTWGWTNSRGQWRIGETGVLQSTGLQKVGHDLETEQQQQGKLGFLGSSVVKNLPVNAGDTNLIPGLGRFPWRRKWQPTPVRLPGKSHGQGSPADSKS